MWNVIPNLPITSYCAHTHSNRNVLYSQDIFPSVPLPSGTSCQKHPYTADVTWNMYMPPQGAPDRNCQLTRLISDVTWWCVGCCSRTDAAAPPPSSRYAAESDSLKSRKSNASTSSTTAADRGQRLVVSSLDSFDTREERSRKLSHNMKCLLLSAFNLSNYIASLYRLLNKQSSPYLEYSVTVECRHHLDLFRL